MKDKPLIIYLDQNKWIDLARAYHNQSGGEKYRQVLEKVQDAVKDRKAIFPLSAFHIVETQNRANLPSRKRLAKVMSVISNGWTIATSERITPIEIQISGSKPFGKIPPPQPNILGRGVAFAFEIDTHSVLAKISASAAESKEFAELSDFLLAIPEVTEILLVGTRETELDLVRKQYAKSLERYKGESEVFRAQFKHYNQSEKFQKAAYLWNLHTVLRENINGAFSAYGKNLDDLLSMGTEKYIEFIQGVPTLDVEIELIIRRNVNWSKSVDKNDLADISFLSLAIPYCDIVVTENSWKHFVQQSGLDIKYNTIILSKLTELGAYL